MRHQHHPTSPPQHHSPTCHHPLLKEPLRWGSLAELAYRLGRPYSTVHKWTANGTLAHFGLRSYRDQHHLWWVEITDEL